MDVELVMSAREGNSARTRQGKGGQRKASQNATPEQKVCQPDSLDRRLEKGPLTCRERLPHGPTSVHELAPLGYS